MTVTIRSSQNSRGRVLATKRRMLYWKRSRPNQKREKIKTCGGPQVVLTPAEEEVIIQIKDKPQMKGIDGGIESSVLENESVEGCTPTKSDGKESTAGIKRKRGSTNTDELYQLEVQRSQLETELLKQRLQQERDLFSMKMEQFRESRQHECTLFSLKKELLTSNITHALDQGLINFEQ